MGDTSVTGGETTYRLGIDVGGTFTDLFLWVSDGRVDTFKVLSTPDDPARGVLDGLRTVAAAEGLGVEAFVARLGTIVHGTTVTTNALLTRRGARTALLTTRGVRDALEMRRGIREEQYNNRFENVVPLVPRRRRLPVSGRLDWRGRELAPLEVAEVREALSALANENIEALALCFMNAFANPAHERAVAELARAALPGVFVSVSTETLPTIRFYNRLSTTVLNAYVGPVFRSYIASLGAVLAGLAFSGTLLIVQSSGGVAPPEVTAEKPATTLLSGPAAGPSAGLATVRPLGYDRCIVVDMGGTSFDASLVQDGAVALKTEGDIERLRIALPMLDITTIGAGGGSIGWVDGGGLLRMGPESAGAAPGPACYGRGGDRPTCTDANVVLGYLEPTSFAGGKLPLSADRARSAIERVLAVPLGLGVEEAAAGMVRVINANMAHGVREITVKRGLDPREFPMVVAGGAGALHACAIATELGIPTLVVPRVASVLCATGMLLTDLQHDFLRSLVGPLDAVLGTSLPGVVAELVAEGELALEREGVSADAREVKVSLDLRYLKQYHEVTVPVSREALSSGALSAIAEAFHAAHDRLYGYSLRGAGSALELINVRVSALGRVPKPTLPVIARGSGDASHALKGTRRAFVVETSRFESLPVYDGHRLLGGDSFAGPALVERSDTTILVGAGYGAWTDDHGSLVLTRASSAGDGTGSTETLEPTTGTAT